MSAPRPGRRRTGSLSLSLMLPFLVLLFTSTASAASAVLGIDLGTAFIKAAIVKPGTPLDIVLTKDSKRKEASVVAFKPLSKSTLELGSFPERLYGGDGLALTGRFPGDVYTNLKPLLGLLPGEEMNAAVDLYKERFPAIQVEPLKDLGTIGFNSGVFNEKELAWSVEELLAMELKNIRTNAEVMTGKGSKITNAVITIPIFYTADERRAVERAAELAGLDVMSLVSDGLAVGIDYAVKRTFPSVSKGEKPEIHMVFDMGAASTTATIVRFQAKDVKDVGRYNKTVQEVTVLGAGWDKTLGGNALNSLLVDFMIDEFTKKSDVSSAGVTGADVKGHGRTASKLWKEAERARHVLSANSDVRSSFEGLYNDIDLSVKLSRSQYEEMAANFANRIKGPVNQALDAAKLTIRDLDSVILHGGAIRTPFVQKTLETIVGKSAEVRTNVNSDESAAFGAAFKAAGMSPSFRVKEIRDADTAIYAAGITQLTDGKDRQQKVFVPTSTAGTVKQLTFKNLDDFDFGLFQQIDGTDRPMSKIQTENLTASVALLKDSFGCTKEAISTKFSMRLSPVDGVPEVVGGTVSCEVEGTPKGGSVGDSVKDWLGFGSKKGDQEPLKEGEETNTEVTEDVDATSTSSASAKSKSTESVSQAVKESKPKKRTEVVNISFTSVPQGLPQPSTEELQRMQERLTAFDRSDKARLQREEALNVLEAYTYRTRDLLTDAGFEEASTEAVRSQLSSLLGTTSEWLYGEGASAAVDVLRTKLSDLKALVDPVQKRREETAARPDKVKALQSALDQTKSLTSMIQDQVSSAEAASASASSEEAASASASTTATAASSDDFADLEEPETSSSTTTAKPSPSLAFTAYTPEDMTSLSSVYDSVSSWLSEKAGEQDKLSPFEDPVITVAELDAKAEQLSNIMMKLLQKKIQMPKRPNSSSKKPKASVKSKKSKSTSATDSVEGETTGKAKAGSATGKGTPNFMTINSDDDMPSEEEILRMVRQAKGDDVPEHGEL